MRQITIKYAGECKRCHSLLDVGTQAMYEKSMGCFCCGCEPKDTEEIRSFRLARNEKRAERYEQWAEKRKIEASKQLNSFPEIRHDWAFITQPGRIPFREKMNRRDAAACESLKIADAMTDKADRLRHVVVKGDAEKRHQARRDTITQNIKPGDKVNWLHTKVLEVLRVNKKTLTLKGDCGQFTADKCLCELVKSL